MANVSTYSFNDIIMTIAHPTYPAFVLNGQGVGEVTIAYPNDNTAQELAADGSVMISKIAADNATVAITMQQTSSLHTWLKGLFNFLNISPAALWAGASIHIQSVSGGFDNITLTGVSPTKRADQPYQKLAQMVTWNFMAANGQTFGSIVATAASIVNNL